MQKRIRTAMRETNTSPIEDRWHVSPLNSLDEVTQDFRLPEPILIHDVTLRDGEQTPGIVFDRDARIRIAKALDGLGVDRIEVGFPLVSKEDADAIGEIAHSGLNAEIWGFGRCLPQDVDLNHACGLRHMILEISVSKWKMDAYGLNREDVKSRMTTAIARAKEIGMTVAFMPVDLTRAELSFSKEIINLAVDKAGADEIVIVDTIGVATPEAIGYLTRQIRNVADVPLAVHCHNDFGLALANSIAALKEGASCIHVSVNCLGERAGNVDLAEVVVALKCLYNVQTGVRSERLKAVSRLVEEIGGLHVSPTKPIIGDRIFTRVSGGVVQQLLTSPGAVEPFEPGLVGLEREVVLGKLSGKYSIMHALNALDIKLSDDGLDRLLSEVKRRSTENRRLLTDDEFRFIVDGLVNP